MKTDKTTNYGSQKQYWDVLPSTTKKITTKFCLKAIESTLLDL